MQFHVVLDLGTNVSLVLEQIPGVMLHVVAGLTACTKLILYALGVGLLCFGPITENAELRTLKFKTYFHKDS